MAAAAQHQSGLAAQVDSTGGGASKSRSILPLSPSGIGVEESGRRRPFDKTQTERTVDDAEHQDWIEPTVLLPERFRIIQHEELGPVSNGLYRPLSDTFQSLWQWFHREE